MYTLKNSTEQKIVIVMVNASNDEDAETGLTVTVQLSKNGGAFANSTNSVTEVSDGFYALTLTTSETDTDGPLSVLATAGGANVFRAIYKVETDAAVSDMDSSLIDKIADTILKRKFSLAEASTDGDGGSSPNEDSIFGALAKEVHKIAMSGSNLTVYKSDGTTVWYTQSGTTGSSGASPIVGWDAAS